MGSVRESALEDADAATGAAASCAGESEDATSAGTCVGATKDSFVIAGVVDACGCISTALDPESAAAVTSTRDVSELEFLSVSSS